MWDGHNHILHIWRLCHLFLSLSVSSHQSANSQIRADLTLVALCLKLHRVVDVIFYKQTSTTQDIYHTRHLPHKTSTTPDICHTFFTHSVVDVNHIFHCFVWVSVVCVCMRVVRGVRGVREVREVLQVYPNPLQVSR